MRFRDDYSGDEMAQCIREVCETLERYGYRAENQLVGYLLTNDPTYITAKDGARKKIQQFDHYHLLEFLVQQYTNQMMTDKTLFDTKEWKVS